jgi:uncharacterized damage-inducible protein DinB
METKQIAEISVPVLNANQLLDHWQGHRKLSRKVIEAFPEDQLFSFSIGGMRPFSKMVMEMIDLADGSVEGIATGVWKTGADFGHVNGNMPTTKDELLTIWDAVTSKIDEFWPQITPERFQQVEKAFGEYEGSNYSTLLYIIDNEVHHRGQGYVYLRALGITPPDFWVRW